MTAVQKVIKYLAIGFAIFLTVTIIGGILSVIGLLGVFFNGNAVNENMKTYSVSSEINKLDIQINAAALNIKEGDVFSIESNLNYLNVEEKDNMLIIKEEKKSYGNYKDAVLTIYIPEDTMFNNINITTGASKLTVDNLSAEIIGFNLGAGDVSIASLIATETSNIKGGAGRITIFDGTLKNLNLEMGVGQLNLTSALSGDCKLDLGVGETNITLLGNKEDYKLEFEKGLGSISVDGKDVSDYGNSGNGTNKIEINGGIGSINVEFK